MKLNSPGDELDGESTSNGIAFKEGRTSLSTMAESCAKSIFVKSSIRFQIARAAESQLAKK